MRKFHPGMKVREEEDLTNVGVLVRLQENRVSSVLSIDRLHEGGRRGKRDKPRGGGGWGEEKFPVKVPLPAGIYRALKKKTAMGEKVSGRKTKVEE